MLSTMHSIPTNGRKLNVAAYARVSSERYEAEMSLENQIDYYTTLILENPNWEYCGVYADEGISGTELLKRKQFKNMVEKALKGMIDIILVKSISRFGRNITDVIGAINKLRAKGVEVFFERESISTLDTTSTIALSLYAELAEQEVISMSQNCAWAVDKRNKAGRYHLPVEEMLGYEYNENNELVIVESEAEIIKVIELFAGVGAQVEALKQAGIEHEVVAISEIDKYAIQTYRKLHGWVTNLGDIKAIKELPQADLWTYSFPCTDISISGQMKGFDKNSNTHSSLLWEVQRLLEVAKEKGNLPRFLLMENVKNIVSKRFKPLFEEWVD